MNPAADLKILWVDDEPSILDAMKRQLRNRYALSVATSGKAGLRLVHDEGPFAIVISDMRMPEMDGIQFLEEIMEISPQSVRMMLTGNADQETAVRAVNQGSIFRFLNKPCSAEHLERALNEA